jgi:hypothetical protein
VGMGGVGSVWQWGAGSDCCGEEYCLEEKLWRLGNGDGLR